MFTNNRSRDQVLKHDSRNQQTTLSKHAVNAYVSAC